MKINVTWNPLSVYDGRRSVEIPAGLTPNEALEVAGLTFKRPFILTLNGDYLGRAEWDTYRFQENDNVCFVELPGIESLGTFLAHHLLMAMAGIGMTMTHGLVVGATYASYAIAGGLVLGGLSLVNRFLTQAQKGPATIGQNDQQYEISSGSNRSKLGSPFPEHFGLLKVFPEATRHPFVRFAATNQFLTHVDQYFYFVGVIGIGHYAVGKVCIGDVDIEDLTYAEANIIEPGESSVWVDNAHVYPCDIINGTQLNEMYREGKSCQCIINPPGTKIDFIEWDMSYPMGSYYVSGSGSINADAGLYFRTLVRTVDDDGVPTSSWTPIVTKSDTAPYGSEGALIDGFYYIHAYSTEPLRCTVRYPVPASLGPGRYEFFHQGVGRNYGNPKFVNTCVVGQVRGINSAPILPLNDATQIEIKIRADAQVFGSIADKINVIAQRKLYPVTATGFGETLTPTCSIADAIAYIVTAENGGKQANSLIDWESLYALRTIWETNGWEFNYRFQSRMSVMEACAVAARCGRAVPYLPGKFLVVMDDEHATPSMKFTARDYTEGSFKMRHNLRTADDPTGIEIHCIDGDTWSDEIIECYDEHGSDENLAVVELPGVTSKQQGYELGMYMYLDDKYNRTDVEFACGLKGHIPLPGARVAIDVPAADGWQHAGVIQQIDGTDIYLSESIEWGEEVSGVLYLTDEDASLIGPYAVTPGAEDYIVSGSLPEGTKTVETDAGRATPYLFAFSADEVNTMRVTRIEPSGRNDVRIMGTIYGALAYVNPGAVPVASQGLLDSISLAYRGVESDAYSYICGWAGSAASVRIEVDEGAGYAIKEDLYTAPTYSCTVATATSITLKITPYDEGVLSPEDALTKSYTVPGTVTGLAVVGTVGEDWEISWDAVSGADLYVIQIYVDGALVSNMISTTTGRSFVLDDMINMGGPYDSWDVHVAAQIGSDVGKPDTLSLSYTGWTPTGLTVEPGLGSATLTATYVKTNSFEACEIWVSETNDRSTAYKIGETGGSSFVALGLNDGSTYYFWCKVRLSGNVYTGWYPESETGGVECLIDYIPDAVTDIIAEPTSEGVQVSWTDQIFESGILYGDILEDAKHWHYKITEGATYETSTEIGRSLSSPFVIKFPGPGTILSAGTKTFWVVVVSSSDVESPATNSASLTIYAPYTPSISTEWDSDVLRLSWSDCKRTLDIDYYEVRHYVTAEGIGTAKTDKVKGLFAQYKIDWTASKTFSVRAVDKAGNAGSYDTEVVTDAIGNYGTTGEAVTATADGMQVSWTNISDCPVKEYKISVGSIYSTSTELGRVTVSPFILRWPFSTKLSSGTNRIWIVGVDAVGNESATSYKYFSISLPTTPSVTAERSKDIIRFTWASCETTFDIDHYRIEATLNAVTKTDKVIGLYAEYKLDWVGTKTFKFYAVDKAGFESSSYDSESVTVSAVGAPTALTTSGGVYEVAVSVTFPTNEYFAGCEIWAATSNNRTYAKKIAEVSSAENPATVIKKLKAELSDSWYFWAKSKDIYGNYSTWYPSGSTSGVLGAPSTTPSDYVDALSGAIDYDDFVASLQAGLGTDVGGTWKYYAGEGYSLHVNENGNITGWRNFIDIDIPTVSTFDIWANKFRIINYNDELQAAVVPFVVGTVNGTSMVGINGDLIVDGTILGRHIKATETITLNSGGKLSIGSAGSIEIGVGGSITILGGMTGYAQISDKPNSLSDINSTEGTKLTGIEDGATVGADWSTNLDNRPNELTDGRIIAGFDSNGNVIRNISGPLLPTTSPTTAGLYINQNYLGYWSGSAWNSYIAANGQFQFLGNASNKITWNGSVLDVRGALVADDIVSGTLNANRIGAASINATKLTFGVIDDSYITNGKHNLSSIYDDAGTLTISAGKLLINTSEGLEIDTAGGMVVSADKGIKVQDSCSIAFESNGIPEFHIRSYYHDTIDSFAIFPETHGVDDLYFGYSDKAFSNTDLYTGRLQVSSPYGILLLVNANGFRTIGIDFDNVNKNLYLNGSIKPQGAAYETGSPTYPWAKVYAKDIYSQRVEQSAADAFQVKLSADQTNLAVGSNITVRFASETNDHTNAFNTSTYTYTAQGDGWRQFNLKLWIYGFDSAATQLTAYIVTSNETFEFAVHPATIMDADGNFQISGSILAYMDNGDTALVKIYQNGGAQQGNIASAYSYFDAHFVND